jgi:hypothetical protein
MKTFNVMGRVSVLLVAKIKPLMKKHGLRWRDVIEAGINQILKERGVK